MLLQHEAVNSWKRNMNKPRASRNPKKYPLPRSIFVPDANGSISGEAKSQSSIISLKISNERDPENVVIEWYRNYRNNKPFVNKLQPRINMSKRQSAGGGGAGGCRSVEIKRSYPCMKCKQLNKKCECARFRNIYRNMYGPTTDETILVGMETLHNLVSSRCSDSRTSVKAVDGTVYKRDNNGGRRRDRDYPSGSDESNIELLELNKNQSDSRKRNEEKARHDNRKAKGNDNGRKGRGYTEENTENARRENTFNKAVRADNDTPSVYSDISKFVSSDGITNDFHSDESRLSLESRYTVENSVSSIDSKITTPNPSPLVSDISNEILTDTVEHAETDIETDNSATLSKHSLSDSPSRAKTDNGTDYDEAITQNDINEQIAQNDINEQIAQRQEQDNRIKHTRTSVDRNSFQRCRCDSVKQEPSSFKHHRNQQEDIREQEQIDEPDTTSTEEIRDDTAEDTDSTEYKKPCTQLYTCLPNPIKNVKTIPVITRFVVPVWDRDKPYPTVHFISSVKDLSSINSGADMEKSSSEPSNKHKDLVEYLLNPMRYLSNTNNKESDSLRRSKSDSSLSVSSVRSTSPLFSEATTNMIRQDNFCLTEDELNSIYSPDERSNRVYIYDTGQRYLPIVKQEPIFAEQNNISKQVYYMFQEKNNKATSESLNNGSVSFSVEISDDENNVMSFSTSSSNIITEDNNASQFDDKARDLAESSVDVKISEGTEPNEMKNEIYLPTENRQEAISDISKSPSNVSMKLTDNDGMDDNGSVLEESILSLTSLQTNTSTSCTETSNSEHNTELLRELNAIVHDRTERQVLTPIQEETETSDTETENKASLLQNTVMPTLSSEQKVENNNSVETNLKQNDAVAMYNSLTKQENDEKEEQNDTSESNPGTMSEEIIMIKQPPNNFDFTSSVYSPAPTTCSCFTICKSNDDDTGNGKNTNDKQINTQPVRIKRESKYQQTDPVKLRPIKSKGDTSSGPVASTTTVSTDSVSVRRGKRRPPGTMGKSRKSSTKTPSVTFERKFSKGDAIAEEIISECVDSVTADEAKSKEIIPADQDMGDRSEQKFASRNLQPRETRYAIARITKYEEFTTYEILKSTRAKPRIIPLTTEGVFTVRNRKKRKLKL